MPSRGIQEEDTSHVPYWSTPETLYVEPGGGYDAAALVGGAAQAALVKLGEDQVPASVPCHERLVSSNEVMASEQEI